MRTVPAISGWRWAGAIACSLCVHALFFGGWVQFQPLGFSDVAEIDTSVIGPTDDTSTTIVLRETPLLTFTPTILPAVPVEPRPLPSQLTNMYTPNGPVIPAEGNPTVGRATDQPNFGATSATPALHGRVKAGKSIIYLLDCSASMGPNLKWARGIIQQSMRMLSTDVSFNIVIYNSGIRCCFNGLERATPEHVLAAEKWLQQLQAEGRSDHALGFRETLSQRPDAIFLLTDADDFDDREVKAISKMIPATTFVNAAVLGSEFTERASPLGQLIQRQHGSVRWYPGS